MKLVKVEGVDDIRRIAESQGGSVDVRIILAGGPIYSRRHMNVCGDGWDVLHCISDTWQESVSDDALLDDDEMLDRALRFGAAYAEVENGGE